jgi:hypothetical protein
LVALLRRELKPRSLFRWVEGLLDPSD